jgi:chemotaxis protein CheC
MQVPQVKLLDFSEVGEMMGGEEQVMVGVFLGVEGDITGSMMFMVEEESARHMIQKVTMGMLPAGSEFEEMGLSAMREVGNIITGAYLNSLSTLTNLKIFPTPPALTVDMAGAILSVPATQFGIFGDKILLIQSKFFDEIELDGYFILIPDMESYARILTSLGLPVV